MKQKLILTIFFILLFSPLATTSLSALPLGFIAGPSPDPSTLDRFQTVSSDAVAPISFPLLNPETTIILHKENHILISSDSKLFHVSSNAAPLLNSKTQSDHSIPASILNIERVKKTFSPFSSLITRNKAWGHTLKASSPAPLNAQASNFPAPITYIIIGILLFTTGKISRKFFYVTNSAKPSPLPFEKQIPSNKIVLSPHEIASTNRQTDLSQWAA